MRKNYIKIFIIIIVIISFITGCWDSHDIEEKNIVTAVVIDKTDNGYAFFVEIAPNSQSKGQGSEQGGSEQKNIILRSVGADFQEAREDLDRKSSKPIYPGKVQCVILTEKMAYSGIEEYMYRMRQDPEYNKTLYVVITAEKPDDILDAALQNNKLVGFSIENTLKTLADAGRNINFSLADLLESLASPNKSYFLPVIGLRDKEIALTGYSVFYEGICKGFIPVEECEGLIIMRAKEPKGSYTLPYKDNSISIKTHMSKRNTDVIYKDGFILLSVKYECEAELLYLSKNISITDEVKQEVSRQLKTMLEKELSDTITKSQKIFGYDYLDFYNVFRIKYPDAAKNIDWLHQYPKAEFNIDVAVDLDMNGQMDYSS